MHYRRCFSITIFFVECGVCIYSTHSINYIDQCQLYSLISETDLAIKVFAYDLKFARQQNRPIKMLQVYKFRTLD